MTNDPDVQVILSTARELYGRAVYTHKVHEQEREIWSWKVSIMNWINIGLAGATTLFAVISAAITQKWALIFTAALAAATVCFAIWQASSDPAAHESRHRVAAKELLWIREQLLLLITNCHLSTFPKEALQKSLEMITREVTAVYKFAPDTSSEAYDVADDMLKRGHFTFSDEEIDRWLPPELRKTRHTSA